MCTPVRRKGSAKPPRSSLHYRRLENGAAGLAMRREPALNDARLDAMAKKFTRREQSARPGTDDQNSRCRCGLNALTRQFIGAQHACPRSDNSCDLPALRTYGIASNSV